MDRHTSAHQRGHPKSNPKTRLYGTTGPDAKPKKTNYEDRADFETTSPETLLKQELSTTAACCAKPKEPILQATVRNQCRSTQKQPKKIKNIIDTFTQIRKKNQKAKTSIEPTQPCN